MTTDAMTTHEALREAEETLRAYRAGTEAERERLPDLQMALARAEARGDLEAMGEAHDAIEELQAIIARRETMEDGLRRAVEARQKEAWEHTSEASAEQARAILAQVQTDTADTRDALSRLIDRIDVLSNLQSEFDTERGRARAGAEKAGIPLPHVGRIQAPFGAWAEGLRQVLRQMEASNV